MWPGFQLSHDSYVQRHFSENQYCSLQACCGLCAMQSAVMMCGDGVSSCEGFSWVFRLSTFHLNISYILKGLLLSFLLPSLQIWQQVHQISTLKFFRTLVTTIELQFLFQNCLSCQFSLVFCKSVICTRAVYQAISILLVPKSPFFPVHVLWDPLWSFGALWCHVPNAARDPSFRPNWNCLPEFQKKWPNSAAWFVVGPLLFPPGSCLPQGFVNTACASSDVFCLIQKVWPSLSCSLFGRPSSFLPHRKVQVTCLLQTALTKDQESITCFTSSLWITFLNILVLLGCLSCKQ